MRSNILVLSALLVATPAFATTVTETESRVIPFAKRVAAMENSRDLPSRAVWLSNRVINNFRTLASLETKTSSKSKKKAPQTLKN